MAHIKADNDKEQAYFNYLEALRKTGGTNMYGSASYLMRDLGLKRDRAVAVVAKWMKLHNDPTRVMPEKANCEA